MKTWDEIEKILCESSAEDVSNLRSPRGDQLKVTFFGGTKLSLIVKEKNGLARLNIDGLSSEPGWVATLGHEFETR